MAGMAGRIGLYAVDAEIGRDATGVTYRAAHLVLPRRALLKVMHAGASPGSPLAVHVLREACLLEALQHPGIVRVYESGLLPDQRPWFARELVEGQTVATLLARGTADEIHRLALLRDIAEVLDHAARRGIIHCGLRPERVVLVGKSRGFPICVTEWGEARAHDAARSAISPATAARPYTAPELVAGDPVDDRADVFALGVIAYQLLAGASAIDDTTRRVPAAVRCPDHPRELTGLVDQMLAHDRWDRPSAGEVFGELTWLATAFEPAAPASPPHVVRVRRPRWTPDIVTTPLHLTGVLAGDATPDGDEP